MLLEPMRSSSRADCLRCNQRGHVRDTNIASARKTPDNVALHLQNRGHAFELRASLVCYEP